MAFWKKKEPKPMPENPTNFQKLWYNKQTNAAMKLGMYFLFIVALVIFINAAGNSMSQDTKDNVEENKNPEKLTYEDMKNQLKNYDYAYEYNIIVDDYKIIYRGEKTKDSNTGYRETIEEIIKYSIEDGKTYSVFEDTKTEIDYLYDKINKDYIDSNYIFLLLFSKKYEEIKENEETIYIYEPFSVLEKDFNITINIINNKIKNIELIVNDDIYILSYELKDEAED